MGGEKSTKSNSSGQQGESFLGAGKKSSAANGGGGGGGPIYGKPGGGGGYGTTGKPGFLGGEGGRWYGTFNLRILHLGSGGGSGSNYVIGNFSSDGRNAFAGVLYGGKGGNGGGALRLDALNRIQVTGQISATGSDGEDGYLDRKTQESGGGGGGGGAGGSIYLRGPDIDVNDGRIMALGGRGGCGTLGRCGGDGGSGLIRIDSDTFTGITEPSAKFEESYQKTFNDLATLARESISISQMNSSNDQSFYLGCFNVENQLSNRVPMTDEESERMTPEFCRQKCYAKNYKYYFLHSANQCFCDSDYGNDPLDDSNCNLTCPGNSSLTCGGSEGISTYGPIPWRPSVAKWASHTCTPWCPVGFSLKSNQSLYGFCSNVKALSWDFSCDCPAGVHGELCELPCFKGKYGLDCEEDCECRNDTVCDPVSGACNCLPNDTTCTIDSSNHQFAIIVSVISSCLVFIIFGSTAICIRRKRLLLAAAAYDSLQGLDNWEISRGDVFLLEQIGQGAFGFVQKAYLYHRPSPGSSTRNRNDEEKSIVACKMLKGSFQNDSDFIEEIKLMKRIGQHPHIVSMRACITISQPLYLVVEYCCHGDLLSNLQQGRLEYVKSQQNTDEICPKKNSSSESECVKSQQNTDESCPKRIGSNESECVKSQQNTDKNCLKRNSSFESEDSIFGKKLSNSCGSKLDENQEVSEHAFKDEENVDNTVRTFTASDLLSFAWQIASGMEYLAGKDLVHRDLACRNVLVCENNMLKVSDFGLTRALYHDGVYMQKKAKLLPIRWMSIEAITHRIFTERSDVWSFGVVIWEICTLGGFPYSCLSSKKVLSYLRGGNRLACPKSCAKELYAVMTECWHPDPQKRPAFSVLLQKLGEMLESEQPNAYISLDNSDWDLDSKAENTESSQSSEKSSASVDCDLPKETADK